jgi:cytochrome c-type biogenesis protein CcmH/NrfF
MMDQNIEHEISSMTYDLLESGVSNDRIMDLVLNEFGDDAYEVVQFILSEESES